MKKLGNIKNNLNKERQPVHEGQAAFFLSQI